MNNEGTKKIKQFLTKTPLFPRKKICQNRLTPFSALSDQLDQSEPNVLYNNKCKGINIKEK